jgi:hypothetical protein
MVSEKRKGKLECVLLIDIWMINTYYLTLDDSRYSNFHLREIGEDNIACRQDRHFPISFQVISAFFHLELGISLDKTGFWTLIEGEER